MPYLLTAYRNAFTVDDNVRLIILTSQYHSTNKFYEEIQNMIRNDTHSMPFPSYRVISEVPETLMPLLYASVNALVSCYNYTMIQRYNSFHSMLYLSVTLLYAC